MVEVHSILLDKRLNYIAILFCITGTLGIHWQGAYEMCATGDVGIFSFIVKSDKGRISSFMQRALRPVLMPAMHGGDEDGPLT